MPGNLGEIGTCDKAKQLESVWLFWNARRQTARSMGENIDVLEAGKVQAGAGR